MVTPAATLHCHSLVISSVVKATAGLGLVGLVHVLGTRECTYEEDVPAIVPDAMYPT